MSVVNAVTVTVNGAVVTVTVEKLNTLTVIVVVVEIVNAHNTGKKLALQSNCVDVGVYPGVAPPRVFCKTGQSEVVRELGPIVTDTLLGPIQTCVDSMPPFG